MRYIFIIVCISIAFQGCNKGLTELHLSEECQQYYEFISSNWEKHEGHYSIKGNPPYLTDGQVRHQYFNYSCWQTLPKKYVKKILGSPNRIDHLDSGDKLYVYCLNLECDRTFRVHINSKGIVQTALPNPSEIHKD